MKQIEQALKQTDGYIDSFIRNTQEGWWEIEVGLPINWVYDENSKIGCEVIFENEVGKLIKIFPKKKTVVIDDLINFVEIIIETNKKIAEKEKQFTEKMKEMKNKLEEEAKQFYQELDELKENSFKKKNDNFIENLDNNYNKTTSENPKNNTTKITSKKKPRNTKKTNIVEKKKESTDSEEN